MSFVSLREFIDTVPGNIPEAGLLLSVLHAYETRYGTGSLRIARKNADLPGVVAHMLVSDWFPVVDRKSRCVFGVLSGSHERARSFLYTYCRPHDATERDMSDRAARYIAHGCGYYISSMHKGLILCGANYGLDRWDGALFASMRVRRSNEDE